MEENLLTQPLIPLYTPPLPPSARKRLPVWAIVTASIGGILVLCCAGLVVLAASPAGRQFIASENATSTAQAIANANAHTTATAYAYLHPTATPQSQPTITAKPIASVTSVSTQAIQPIITPTQNTHPTATPTQSAPPIATTVPIIPDTFVGLGGTFNAYQARFVQQIGCGVGLGCWATTINECNSMVDAAQETIAQSVNNPRIDETGTTYNCSLPQYPTQAQTTAYCNTFLPSDASFQQTIVTHLGNTAQQYSSRLLKNTLASSDFSGSPGTFYFEVMTDGCIISTSNTFLI